MNSPRITTIIATSPIPSAPAISHLRETLNSLGLVPELAASPIRVVFDAPPNGDSKIAAVYDDYKTNVARYCENRSNVELIHLDEWGHLSGVMTKALETVNTPFLFVQQHDLPLIRNFDFAGVMKCLVNDDAVKYVRLNRRHNLAIRRDRTPLFGAYENPYVPLTRTACWSDQSHLTTTDYYREIVLPEVRGRKVFMEDVLNCKMDRSPGPELTALHQKFGTYIYGAPGAPPVIRHTDGRNN